MAPALCHHVTNLLVTTAVNPVPRVCIEQCAGIHLEQAESRDEAEFSGNHGLYGAIFAMGPYGFLISIAWKRAKGRDLWGDRRS